VSTGLDVAARQHKVIPALSATWNLGRSIAPVI